MHTLASDNIFHVTWGESLTGRALDPENSKNISSLHFIDFLHVVGMQLDHSADFQFFLDFIIPYKISLFELALVHSDISQLTEFRFFELKNIPNERFFFVANQLDLLFLLFCVNLVSQVLYFRWRWKEFKDAVQGQLDSLVFVS